MRRLKSAGVSSGEVGPATVSVGFLKLFLRISLAQGGPLTFHFSPVTNPPTSRFSPITAALAA
jgi:hypothetical protein